METKKPINEEQFKEFGPASFSVKNVTTVYVLTAIIFLSGLMAYISMPSETFPEIVTHRFMWAPLTRVIRLQISKS
jgi:hypothetical protein